MAKVTITITDLKQDGDYSGADVQTDVTFEEGDSFDTPAVQVAIAIVGLAEQIKLAEEAGEKVGGTE